MSWLERALDHLSRRPISGYQPADTPAVEPTALAAMALIAHGRTDPASRALDWLGDLQSQEGFLGIRSRQSQPHWATGWAVMAWLAGASGCGEPNVRLTAGNLRDAVASNDSRWVVAANVRAIGSSSWKGQAAPRSPEFAHDTTLQGWSWVEGTHSWVEPTAINLGSEGQRTCGSSSLPRSSATARDRS